MNKSFIIRKEKMVTSKWEGGKTTELFIYPENSSLKDLNFDFRLSTATIEVEKSNFTPLKGVKRILMPLSGKLKLEHEGQHSKEITVFDVDKFCGNWKTTSYGETVGLNLMTTKTYQTKLSRFVLPKNTQFRDRNYTDFSFIYLYKGTLETNYGKLNEGDILVIGDKELYDMKTNVEATLVHISISLLN